MGTVRAILPWVLALLLAPAVAAAQGGSPVGVRAQGMGGAFVGVADDASAVYWNPAGLAGGALFSLVLDGGTSEALPDGRTHGAARSSWLLALTTPALGLSYYRLAQDRVTVLMPPADAAASLDAAGVAPLLVTAQRHALVTHHAGATLVQSLTDSLAVGTTLKAVHGIAGSALVLTGDREHALRSVDLIGRRSTKFDLDFGVMSRGALGSIGLIVRNVVRPQFETASSEPLRLPRQARLGASVSLLRDWKVSSDVDLNRVDGPFGRVREFAVGTEGQVMRRLAARAGLRLNTADGARRAPSVSVGASYAAYGAVLVDAHATVGSDEALRGWGLAGRIAF